MVNRNNPGKEVNTILNLDNIFTYHETKPEQLPKYLAIRAMARELAELIQNECPDSRERVVALTNVQQAVMWANASIAINS